MKHNIPWLLDQLRSFGLTFESNGKYVYITGPGSWARDQDVVIETLRPKKAEMIAILPIDHTTNNT